MSRRLEPISPILLPADIDDILENYEYILESYQNLQELNSIYGSFKLTKRKLDVLFPFKEHPLHGITGLHATEKYDGNGHVREYHYQWKRIIPKEGIMFSHISAWENEPHDAPNTPEEYIVVTEPHHHHYIPGERRHRKANYDIRTLEAAFKFVAQYIESGKEYKP
ncbi:toxin-antitoxin system TumE family protein [Sporosarcina sp. CAU 1771]